MEIIGKDECPKGFMFFIDTNYLDVSNDNRFLTDVESEEI